MLTARHAGASPARPPRMQMRMAEEMAVQKSTWKWAVRMPSVGIGHLQHLQDGYSEDDAALWRSHQGEDNTLENDLRENHLRRGADGSANAYLGGSLLHHYDHHVWKLRWRWRIGANTYQPDEEVDTLKQVVQHSEEHLRIEHHDSFFV